MNLNASDFVINEDGKRQMIISTTRADASSLSVALLIDKSGSTRDSGREATKAVDAAIQFVRSISQPGRDQVALVTFDTQVSRDMDFTDDFQRLLNIVNRTLSRPSGGGTAVHDALYGAARLLGSRPGRRMILMVGDGEDTASALSLPDTMKTVHNFDVEIRAIWMPSPNPSPRMFSNVASVGRESLKRISGETGGRYFESTELKELEKSTQEMSGQYLMEYQSTNSKADKKFRKIRVESVNKNYKVRHREGYWSP
jgi:VWFA-related protein